MIVPCGRCVSCRVNRAEDWTHRMFWESDYFTDVSFMTLTYSDEFLPTDLSVDKRVLQLFFKRLRKGFDTPIKYFACGEYGELGGRPHYHAVVFGIASDRDSDFVFKSWGFGNVSLSPFKAARARYCAGYLLKEVDSSIDLVGRSKPFALMSKKLGLRYLDANRQRILDTDKPLTINGVPVATPRYFRKKLGIKSVSSEYLIEQRKFHLMRIGGWKDRLSIFAYEDSLSDVRNQVAANRKGFENVKRENSNGI